MLGIPFVLDIDELQSSAVLRGVCIYLSIGIWDVIRDYLGQGLAKDREHFGVAAILPALKEEGFLNSKAPSQRLGRVLGLDWFAQSERNTYRTSNSSIFVPISDAKKFGAEYNRFLLIRAVSSTTWHWEKV
ncbi:hypothetical protein OIU74_021829 [Salix koriyanagi]|uniref:Uncharacterized protein n=1 Tax=Salix koriyanagi TaxID=2511006 RepID=A0A9Q1AEF8_9ROSI|nr:hypothetical protein OIU74_021829 [Salix koriyanagi]